MNISSKKVGRCGMIMVIVLMFFLLIWLSNSNTSRARDTIGEPNGSFGEHVLNVEGNTLGINSEKNQEDFECVPFEEHILWSSGYAYDPEGLTRYQTWYPKHNCAEVQEQNCFLSDVEIQTRFLYFGYDNGQAESYIQISNPDESICKNPERGIYSRYVAYETFNDGFRNVDGYFQKSDWYCGSNKNQGEKCGIGLSENSEYTSACYGIKAYAAQDFLVDALKVKYKLCWWENE